MALASEYFWKEKTLWKVKDSCYEHITVGVNIYLYWCVSLLGPECAVCLCVCVCVCFLCEIKSEYQQKTTLRVRPQYIHSVYPTPFMLGGGGGGGCLASNQISKKGGGIDRISIFRGGLLGKRKWLFSGEERDAVFTKKKISKISNV